MNVKRHHVTGQPPKLNVRPDDETYSLLLDSKVVQCIDILPMRADGCILLGHRTREPQPSWWVFGGAMPRLHSPEQGAALNFSREMSLDLPASRFSYVGWFSLVWDTRAQVPSANGCHMTTALFAVMLSPEEISLLEYDEEYDQVQWVTPVSVLDGTYHPALKSMVAQLISTQPLP